MNAMSRRLAACALALLAAACVVACAPSGDTAPAAPTPAAVDARFVAIARGRVDVPGGLLRVATAHGGLIDRWSVDAGDAVKQGQVLVQLDAREARMTLALAKAEQAHAVTQLDALRTEVLVARARRERAQAAPASGAAGVQALEDARFAVIYTGQQQAAQEAALLAQQQRVAQAQQRLDAGTVRAPADGRVVQRAAQVGEFVEPHGLLMHLLPDGPRIVRADLSELLIGRVEKGMRAEVVSIADDAVVHAARVLSVGEVFGPPRVADTAGGETVVDARVVECLLQLDEPALRVGQRVLVRFLPSEPPK